MNDVLFHGSVIGGIKVLEPRKRYTPAASESRKLVYATDVPAFAAAHAFPWSSDEGIDVDFEDGEMYLSVPKSLRDRLMQKIYIYSVPGDGFALTVEEQTGHTYHSESAVEILEVQEFETVEAAVRTLGGKIIYL